MVGKRVVLGKRPAVLCTAVFMLGIVLAKCSGWLIAGITVGMFCVGIWVLRRLRKVGRQISMADRLLFAVPVFLLLGIGVMRGALYRYERNVSAFAGCMEAGKEVLVEGKVSHIGQTGTGVRLELTEAVAAPYDGASSAYYPVGTLVVYVEDCAAENGEIKYGQRIFVYGSGSIWEEASNPGGFDAKTYYFSMGITGAVHGKAVRIRSFSYDRLRQTLFHAKNTLLQSFVTYLGEENAGVIASMLLGERALLSEETEELYRHGGISHILAISGLHVSLLGTALYELLRKSFLGRNGAIPVACGAVLLYGSFVGAGTSTKRAVIMFLLLLLATALGRTYDTLSAMSVSALVILGGSPGALYTASFQLSYGAAYGASVFAALLRERAEDGKREGSIYRRSEDFWKVPGGGLSGVSTGVRARSFFGSPVDASGIGPVGEAVRVAGRSNSRGVRVREYVMGKLKSMFLFGLAIQAVTFPFTVYHFFEYPTYGFFLNPVVVPLMTILLLCGFLAGICGLLVPWLGYFFAGGAGGILWIYETLCRWTEKLPGSLLLIGKPAVWQIAVYYVLLAVCLYVWLERGSARVVCEKGDIRSVREEIVWEDRKDEVREVTGNSKEWKLRIWYSFCCMVSTWRVCVRNSLGRQGVFATILLCLPLCLLPVSGSNLAVSFLSVGQGDGIVLREQGGAVILVDGGSVGMQKVGEKCLIPYLKSQGIRVIDCAFVSHTDSDHMSGVKELLEAMPVYSEYRESAWGYTGTPVIKRLVLPEWYGEGVVAEVVPGQGESVIAEIVPGRRESVVAEVVTVREEGKRLGYAVEALPDGSDETAMGRTNSRMQENSGAFVGGVLPGEMDDVYLELLKLAEEKQVEVCYMAAGDRMRVGEELVLSCLAPESDVLYDNKNAASMVLLASYGTFDMLLTGDMEADGEMRLLESGMITGGMEVLKVSHHGSRTASSEEFISVLQPQIAVISCGRDNRYGHPHRETLETFSAVGSHVYRTDENGCIRVTVGKNGRMLVQTWRKPDEGE